jgi:hypothetical protein
VPATGSLGAHTSGLPRALQRLDRLPAIALALIDTAWLSGRFALSFVVPLWLWWDSRRLPTTVAAGAIGGWLLLAVPVVALPFLLSPIDDLQHHLKSSLPRLLLHWCGVAWVWSAAQPWPAAANSATPAARPELS